LRSLGAGYRLHYYLSLELIQHYAYETLNENKSKEKSTSFNNQRIKPMKILAFIYNDIGEYGAYCLQEIVQPLQMNENTAHKNLSKLVEIGLLEKTVPVGNKRERYYEVIDKILAKKRLRNTRNGSAFALLGLYHINGCMPPN
jgi:DNA-binding MarR family transcriptional regulator